MKKNHEAMNGTDTVNAASQTATSEANASETTVPEDKDVAQVMAVESNGEQPLSEDLDELVSQGTAESAPADITEEAVRGLSWTTSLDIACWFARVSGVYANEEPAVYKAILKDEDIYFYDNEGEEREFVGRPKTCRRLPLTRGDILERAEEHGRRKKLNPGFSTAKTHIRRPHLARIKWNRIKGATMPSSEPRVPLWHCCATLPAG